MKNKSTIDLRPSTTATGELSQTTINIIESNTGTQVDHEQLYTELVVTNGQVDRVYKYEDSTKVKLLFDITINWLDGVPSSIVSTNVDDSITITTTLASWVDGIPTQITRTKA